MRSIATAAAAALLATAFAFPAAVTPADAKGCIKGAVVGGVAGHLYHRHGLIGAAAGCAVGHHIASKQAKR